MALAQARIADANETRFLLQVRYGRAPAITHAGLQSAHHLMNDHRNGSTIRNASFDAFWDELAEAISVCVGRRAWDGRGSLIRTLEVAFARSLRHCAQRSHASI